MVTKNSKTFVYVDGFNFYYGCLKKTPYKWINLLQMCQLMFKKYDIQKVRYFTAKVKPQQYDMTCDMRQQTYLRALRTLPQVEIHYGQFTSHQKKMPLAHPKKNKEHAHVIRTDEKGSDVNLASYLLMDGFNKLYDTAIVISNDSDLFTPVKMVRDELKKRVIVANPQEKVSMHLKSAASFVSQIRQGVLAGSQFPPQMQDHTGHFQKPSTW